MGRMRFPTEAINHQQVNPAEQINHLPIYCAKISGITNCLAVIFEP